MSDPSPIVKTRLKEPMYARFREEQTARGISESALLRLALREYFERCGETSTLPDVDTRVRPRPVIADPEQSACVRKTVWMPIFLMTAVAQRADDKGMSCSRWISALVQSNLMRHPVLTESEVLAIEGASRELAAIGRNINQIARTLNEAYFQAERIRMDKLAELSAKITTTRTAIGVLIRTSRRTWRVD